MLTTIKGYYEDGHIIFTESPPALTKTEVIITFLPDEKISDSSVAMRQPGGLKGLVTIPDDFNEPLNDLKDYMY
jgi:hypothetical protein